MKWDVTQILELLQNVFGLAKAAVQAHREPQTALKYIKDRTAELEAQNAEWDNKFDDVEYPEG